MGADLTVVQIIDRLDPAVGGPARNAFELNLALNAMSSVTADLFWLRGSYASTVAREFERMGGQLPEPGPRKMGAGTRGISAAVLREAIKRADAIVIHGYYSVWGPAVASIAQRAGTPVMLTPHGALGARQQQYSRVRKRAFEATIGRRFRGAIASFVVGSPQERDDLIHKFPGSPVSITGVGTTLPLHAERERRPSRSAGSGIRLLTLSRIAPKKRIDLAIRTIAELHRRGVPAELTIAGEGDPKLVEKLRTLASMESVAAHVLFTGGISGNAKADAFGSADVFLAPSEEENFGISTAEAIAHGVPVVASTGVASAQMLSSQVACILDPCTPAAMADAAIEFMSQDPLQVARVARMEAGRLYSWAAVAERWVSVIRTSTIV